LEKHSDLRFDLSPVFAPSGLC